MTDIEQKALALIAEIRAEQGQLSSTPAPDYLTMRAALIRAIEQHETFRQEVSDAAVEYNEHGAQSGWLGFDHFIAKPDPLAEAIKETHDFDDYDFDIWADQLRAAVEKRGGKIVWGDSHD